MRVNRERALEIQRKRKLEQELEDFERGAPPHVSKAEAMRVYCLPEGTLAVCRVVAEKDNPRNKNWTKMKLYDRQEIRRRARERFGGLEGLQEERRRREEKRFEKDLEKVKEEMFGSGNSTNKKQKK